MRAVRLSAALLVLLAAVAPPAAAQQISPLAGQGQPDNATTEIFMSVYLDRLLAVDEKNYRHSEIMYFYITWRDPLAYGQILERTAELRAADGGVVGSACSRPCADFVGNLACCDTIFIPAFTFRNVAAFPEDRPGQTRIYATNEGSVVWMAHVMMDCFQPMQLQNFPFDSFDLLIQVELQDTSAPDHPGLRLVSSAAGTTLAASSKGDAVSQWRIDDISINVVGVPAVSAKYFADMSEVQSNPDDPLGLTNTDAILIGSAAPGAVVVPAKAERKYQAFVAIRITRFWGFHLLNTVLPIVILGLLCFIAFSLDTAMLSERLGIVVTLFLSMAAVQFVVQAEQPASSYILPTQQAALTTYALLGIIALESIWVYRIDQHEELAQKAELRENARREYEEEVAARKAARRGGAAADPGLPLRQSAADEEQLGPGSHANGDSGTPSSDGLKPGPAPAEAAHAPATSWWAKPASWCSGSRAACGGGGGAAGPARVLRRSQTRLLHPAYYQYRAYRADKWAFWVLLLLYILAIVLIFSLQNGYVG